MERRSFLDAEEKLAGMASVHAPLCPLCGKPNECAASRTGSFSEPCWCASAMFSAELIARVPAAQQGKACICRSCAQTSKEVPP